METSDVQWKDARSPYEAMDAEGYGLRAEELRQWTPFYPLEIYWAKKHGLPLETARDWAKEGVRVQEAVRAVRLGMTRDDIREWLEEEFSPTDAIDATEARIDLGTAKAWRDVGFILPHARALIEEGWDLEEARRARYIDIDRYATRGHGQA